MTFSPKQRLARLRRECKARGWRLVARRGHDDSCKYVAVNFTVGEVSGRAYVSTHSEDFHGFLHPHLEPFSLRLAQKGSQPWHRTLVEAFKTPSVPSAL